MSKKKVQGHPRATDSGSHVEDSSGNVFQDMGLPDAESRLVKSRLAQQICRLIRAAKLSQQQAAEKLGIDQPKISALVRGRLKEFSTERLMRFIAALDQDVVITIREPRDSHHAGVRVLVEA
jgi:predicted XRE-type DNA-binding protein